MRLSVNATNLFDRIYVSQCIVQALNNACVYGLKRQVIAVYAIVGSVVAGTERKVTHTTGPFNATCAAYAPGYPFEVPDRT